LYRYTEVDRAAAAARYDGVVADWVGLHKLNAVDP
jgi:hypothetical protein